jgi:hypothetical protein
MFPLIPPVPEFTPPGNDNFANAIAIAGEFGNIVGTLAAATTEVSEPNHNGAAPLHSVWYVWAFNVGNIPHNVELELTSNIPIRMAVYTGSVLASLVLVEEGTNLITFETLGNGAQNYRIAIDTPTDVMGQFKLEWLATSQFILPANDNFANAAQLSGLSGTVNTDNTYATAEVGEPTHNGSPAFKSLWYKFILNDAGYNFSLSFNVSTSAIAANVRIALYKGASLETLVLVDNSTTEVNTNTLGTGVEQTYYIAVDSLTLSGAIALVYEAAVAGGPPPAGEYTFAYAAWGSLACESVFGSHDPNYMVMYSNVLSPTNPREDYFNVQREFSLATNSDWALNFSSAGFDVDNSSSVNQQLINSTTYEASTFVYFAWGSLAMSTIEYAGANTAQSITGVGFQPDLLWIKSTDAGFGHMIIDSSRGPDKVFGTSAFYEQTSTNGVTSFNADGFSLGANENIADKANAAGVNYVAHCWQIGTYLDIVQFTANGTGAAVAHGLGVVPAMIWLKGKDGTFQYINWQIYHQDLGANTTFSFNPEPNGIGDEQEAYENLDVWDNTAPTSTDFYYGSYLESGEDYVAYLFAEVDDETRFGSYTGDNGTLPSITTGTTGFEPVLLMIYCAYKNRRVDLGFQPDLVWIKSGRNSIFDSVRGALESLSPSEGAGQRGTIASSLVSFDTSGFTMGPNYFPIAAQDYYAVGWQIGPHLDIIQFTAVSGVNTVPHSLGAIPKFFFVACSSAAQNWLVYHAETDTGNTGEVGFLWPSLDAAQTAEAWFNSAPPDVNDIFILADNGSNGGYLVAGRTYVVYAFAEVTGESQMGTYNGNLLVFSLETLGFAPRELIIKNTELDGTHWVSYQPTGSNPRNDVRFLTSPTGRNTAKNNLKLNLNALSFSLVDPDSESRFINDDTRAVREDRHYTYSAWQNGVVHVSALPFQVNFQILVNASLIADGKYIVPDRDELPLNYGGYTLSLDADGFSVGGYDPSFLQFINTPTAIADEFVYMAWSSAAVSATLEYTGDGTGQSITGIGFQPDFVWIKNKTGAPRLSVLFDSVRGPEIGFYFTSSNEFTDSNSLTSFDADGFTVGSSNAVNANGEEYLVFCFQIGTYLDIVTFTGNGSSGTVSHSLGVAPGAIWVKDRSGAAEQRWKAYHSALPSPETKVLNLSLLPFSGNVASTAVGTYWDNTAPTSSDFTFGDAFEDTINYVAYVFGDVANDTAFGSYTGNNTPPTITGFGFQPTMLMVINSTKKTVIADVPFQPDLIWLQRPNWIWNSLGGVNEPTRMGDPGSIVNDRDKYDVLLSFDSGGFTLGSGVAVTGFHYAYCWEIGPYLDIVEFTSTTGLQTIAHNLGVVPEMIWVVPKEGFGAETIIYHVGIPAAVGEVGAFSAPSGDKAHPDANGWFDGTPPTATDVYLLADNGSNGGRIAETANYTLYVFAPGSGADFGSYIGDEITAPSATTGFQPKLSLIKNAYDDNTGWIVNPDNGQIYSHFLDPFIQNLDSTYRTTFNATGFKVDDFADALSVNQDPAVVLVLPPSFGPANDNFDDRILLTASGSRSLSNVNATAQAGEPAHAGTAAVNSIWFNWICSTPGAYLTFTAPDKRIGVYTGTVLASLVEVASGTGQVQIFHETGTTDYAIAIDSTVEGVIKFSYSDAAPPLNNNFYLRFSLTGTSGSINASNLGANLQAFEIPQYGGNSRSTVWWQWSFTDGGSPLTVLIDTASSNFDTTLHVFTGINVDGLILKGRSDDTPTTSQSAISFLTPGLGGTVTYQIAVGGYKDAQGAIVLNYSVA